MIGVGADVLRGPALRASGSRDRVEAKSSDSDDPEEDEEHEHDELRLLERRLGLRRRDQYKLRLSSNQTLTKWHTLQSMHQGRQA